MLDKYKISKTFFVKTDQADCAYLDQLPEETATEKPAKQKTQTNEKVRSAVGAEGADTETKKKVTEAEVSAEKVPALSDIPKIIAEPEQPYAAETVPERILKVAGTIEEESGDGKDKTIAEVTEKDDVESAKGEKSEEQPKEIEKTA